MSKMPIPELLADSALNWAFEHVHRFGDTDVFPIAFEFRALRAVWPQVLDTLRKIDLAQHEIGSVIRMMVPKHTTGYRSAVQLDPIDCLLSTGLVYEMSKAIESFRIPPERRIACAYRLEIQVDGQLFRKETGWADFHEQSEASQRKDCKYVILADISDFYNQISHHRIQNALSSAGVSEAKSKATERFLGNINAGHHSRGIPVGPAASILLAECALADVDNFLLRRKFRHTRYVDDFRILLQIA